jgi:asparagine synthase (glutamine-hydrolysing)
MPVTLRPLLEPSFGWERHDVGQATVWFRGYVHGRSAEAVADQAARLGRSELASWLDALDGHYSLVVVRPGSAFAASDPVRSYPLIWARRGDDVFVTHDGPALEDELGLGPRDIESDMALAVAMSGYTIGDATLYSDVRQIGPGEFLWVDGEDATQERYYRWTPWLPDTGAEVADLREPLSRCNAALIEALVKSAAGRPILVPLSAGLDSRLIVSGLKEAGYDTVSCVAYGLPGNREAVTSREIARRLGYDWTFIPYTQRTMRQAFHSADHARYTAYSDSLTGMHFPQEYRLLAEPRRDHAITPDTIVVNGQTGDFIAGNHVPQALFEPGGSERERLDRIIAAFLAKHYRHWSSLGTPERLETVHRRLESEIAAIGGLPDDPAGDHGIYEYCEYQDRQSKYVLNGQRIYEYMGLDWRLPLWDRAYMDFWAKAPLAAKQRERLYRDVLMRDDWAGVWRSIPTNPTRIRPAWVRPLRFAAKAMHAPLGRARWHRFEKRYFEYWMAGTCAYAAWPYRRVARDRRGHQNVVAWHAAEYLKGKGLAWDGRQP